MDVYLTDELVAAYASLFVHCEEQYAVQQRDGSYWRVARPLTLPLLSGHLLGRWSLGTYLLDHESRCSFAVFDADSEDGLMRLTGLADGELAPAGIPTVLEASRRGGHLWVHLDTPTPAELVRAWLLPYADEMGVELYPKQDALSPGGSGSLIRLPLGIHQKSKGWYPFVQWSEAYQELVPVGQTVTECCVWACEHVQRVAVPAEMIERFERVAASGMRSSGRTVGTALLAQPAFVPGSIRAWCRMYNIEEVIGRFVALDSRGVGSCPFKEHHHRGDVHPSFQVFGGDDPHWYCHAWGRAGNLFDFVCLYYQLTVQEAWACLCAGTLL